MKPSLVRCLVLGLLALWLTACSRLDAPEPGDYRAVLNLKGGELPLLLKITPPASSGNASENAPGNAPINTVSLALLAGDQTFNANQVAIQNGKLTAEWAGLGTLSGEFSTQGIRGELRIKAANGHVVALPLTARRDQPYRFTEQSSSDNADVSGSWQLEALSTDHFNTPMLMQLRQQHDQVDGSIQLPEGGVIGVIGQTRGDDVWLGLLGQGRAVLLKGKVNDRGELQGEFWVNLESAQPWIARHDHHTSATDVADRQVGMPWAVPVRELAPTPVSTP